MAILKRLVLLFVVLLVGVGHTPVALATDARPGLTEAQAKAGFLYNCALFVTWPSDASTSKDLVIGVVGDEAVAAVVKDMQGQKVNGRTLRVSPVRSHDDLTAYHILFVAGGDSTSTKAVLERLAAASVLTVGESADFTTTGGVVRLFTDQGRLRFEINMTRAEHAGLGVSSKMLGLARIVR
jgi:hypothetical protein